MSHTIINPPPILVHPTTGPYSHALEIQPDLRWVVVSGQVPLAPDGTIPEGIEAQTKLVWQNLIHILAEAGMDMTDVVKLTHYVTGREHLEGYNRARAEFMGDVKPASTLLLISGLARPEFLVEVDLMAAKAP